MHKSNHFSPRLSRKTTEELRQIKSSKDHTEDARLAALWELEKRGEGTAREAEEAVKIEEKKVYREKLIEKDQRYNTFLPRLVAIIIDWVLMLLVVYGVGLISAGNQISEIQSQAISVALELLVYIYSIVLHGLYGQTMGKMAMGVKVVRFEDEKPIDFNQAFMRDIVPVGIILLSTVIDYFSGYLTLGIGLLFIIYLALSAIPSIWGLIEVISMLTNEKSRAVHDFIAKTVVIRTQ